MKYLLTGNIEIDNFEINNSIEINHIYFGEYISNETHYFTIISDNKRVFLINSYGGLTNLIIKEFSIIEINLLLKDIFKNNKKIVDLFGIYPSKYSNIENIILKTIDYNIPSNEKIIYYINILKDFQTNIEDKNNLSFIKDNIEEYFRSI